MSDTKVDMPKVCQMLDNDWEVKIYKNQLTSYTAEAVRNSGDDFVETDDFTPEQALTRLAYKVFGEII